KMSDLRTVTLYKGKAGFGFSLLGPAKAGPAEEGEPVGIFISRILPEGAAIESGQVFEGDQILSMNGQDLALASYRQAANLVKHITDGVMTLNLTANPGMYDLYKQ
nr:Chain A, mbDLG-3 protein [Monosiga brevicollis]